ncbi:hypothetical protein [Rhodococcus spongiicola]|uniref:Uncharacterized protein n=1 Tax=Rhodococcus spongiicola TaxID=2487352 RepID=A0A3S3BI03_9NOCA|nr:hypothetical protein [Rhodococcus spongiicola]RVW01728.1 hypothetical protein EF834_15160 [Rhodococcus spongiicola]
MTRRISAALAAVAVTLSLGAFGAPAASAASLSEAQTPVQGSVGLCLVIPFGSLVLPICL